MPSPGRLRVALYCGVLAAAAVFGGHQPSHAQSKRPMTLVDLLNMPRVSADPPSITSDGQRILFTLLTTDWPGNRRIPQVWTVKGDGSGLHRLTSAESGASGGQW